MNGHQVPSLDLVAALVNTRAITHENPHAREDLDSPAALERWWAARSESTGTVHATAADLDLTLAVREGLRALLAHHNDAHLDGDDDAIARLAAASDVLPLLGVPDGAGALTLRPAGADGVRHALAGILCAAAWAYADGSWSRLKICRDPACREAFYDTSRNRSRTWCSMAVCGSRAKQRTFADRRRVSG